MSRILGSDARTWVRIKIGLHIWLSLYGLWLFVAGVTEPNNSVNRATIWGAALLLTGVLTAAGAIRKLMFLNAHSS